MEGINGISPVIKKLSFNIPGEMKVYLEDGRKIITPLKLFPSIKKLSFNQRKKWQIVDDQIIAFRDSNEYIHLEHILGKEQDYNYSFTKILPSQRKKNAQPEG